MRVRYTAAAEIDLQTIYLSGWEMFGRRQADVYAAGLRAAVQMIADFPLASRLRDTIRQPVRARPFQSHVILYTVDEAGILILRFRHGLEDWQDALIDDREDNP